MDASGNISFFSLFPLSSFSFMEKSLWDDTDRDGTTLGLSCLKDVLSGLLFLFRR